MPNPFYYGGRIEDPNNFIGRKDELQYVFSRLEALGWIGQPLSISIIGPRRIGKSSLLYYLSRIYRQRLSQPESYLFAYLDLERAACRTLPGLLGALLELLLEQLQEEKGVVANRLNDKLRAIRRNHIINLVEFEEAIVDIGRLPGPRLWPILCLDELECLLEKPVEFPLDLYQSWRSLISANQAIFIVASMKPLVELAQLGGLTSPFFNAFDHTLLPLGDLASSEANELLNRGRTCDRPFSDDECQRILKLAGSHPWRLQIVSSLVYEAKAVGQTVNWNAVRQRYKKQVNPRLPPEPWWRIALSRFDHGLRWLLSSPKYVGRLVLLLLKRSVDDEAANWLAGTLTLILTGLIVAGVIGWNEIKSWVVLLLGQK